MGKLPFLNRRPEGISVGKAISLPLVWSEAEEPVVEIGVAGALIHWVVRGNDLHEAVLFQRHRLDLVDALGGVAAAGVTWTNQCVRHFWCID